jgi:hypothetical protein
MLGAQIFDALGARWTLFLGTAAQCAVEEQYNRGFFAVVADAMPGLDAETAIAVAQSMSDGSALSPIMAARAAEALKGMRLSLLRDLAWHGLRRHHPGIEVDQVDEIIDDLGYARFGEVIGAAIQAAQGRGGAEKGKGAGGDAAPGKPATPASGPIGSSSSSGGRKPGSKPKRSGTKA